MCLVGYCWQHGLTALMYATQAGHLAVVRKLVRFSKHHTRRDANALLLKTDKVLLVFLTFESAEMISS